MTPSGIEPATFRFVAQYLNHCAAAVPTNVAGSYVILRKYFVTWTEVGWPEYGSRREIVCIVSSKVTGTKANYSVRKDIEQGGHLASPFGRFATD
jgi:hypothetical protein